MKVLWVLMALCCLSPVLVQGGLTPPLRLQSLALALDTQTEQDLACLKQAYGNDIRFETPAIQGDDIWLIVKGRRVLYHTQDTSRSAQSGDMGKTTVRESMEQRYPPEPARPMPGPDERPGRLRSYTLLNALYGPHDIQRQGTGKYSVTVSTQANMTAATQRIMQGLTMLVGEKPALAPYILPLGGYAKRRIAGTDRASAHSYGIAIDLNPRKGAYWRWSGEGSHPAQITYPTEIVMIFEKEGFIWGGKWREYDLMHFEYRPELLCKAKATLP